jgi:hypothetical protein
LYSLVGSRIFLPPDEVRTLVDRSKGGVDVTPEQIEMLERYGNKMWCWNEEDSTRMTRARIRYEGSTRMYVLLNRTSLNTLNLTTSRFQSIVKPPLRTFGTLVKSPLVGARYLHVSPPYSPEDLHAFITEMKASNHPWRPKIVFEPSPTSCHPGQKHWLELIAKDIYVLSYVQPIIRS